MPRKQKPKHTDAADSLFAPPEHQRAPDPNSGPVPEFSRFAGVVSSIVDDDLDVDEEYRALVDALKRDEALTPTNLDQQVYEAEDNARRAYNLYIIARVTHERFEVTRDVFNGAMRDAANADLQSEKNKGERSKSITDKDVVSRAALLFPDKWQESQDNASRASGALDGLRALADRWASRCYSLSGLASRVKTKR